jgi:biopolymer transport protein ExbB
MVGRKKSAAAEGDGHNGLGLAIVVSLAWLFGTGLGPGPAVAETVLRAPPPAESPSAASAQETPSFAAPPEGAPLPNGGPAVAAEPPRGEGAAPAGATEVLLRSSLPRDLSPWGMFLSAVPIVQAVMIILAFASFVTWTVWLAKTIEIWTAKRSARRGLEVLAGAANLRAADKLLTDVATPAARFAAAAAEESSRSKGLAAEGIKERASFLLTRIEAQAGRKIARGTGILATIGATAVFVGLFGTVWGIMDSFVGISRTHTTNLAVVAPGIAEALLTTAAGLVAAVPAVVMYNSFARSISGYRALLADAAAEVLRLLSRDLDRDALARKEEAPVVPLRQLAE